MVAMFTPHANAFRFYDDDAGEAASTPLANQDVDVTIDVSGGNVAFQLRIRIDEVSGADGSTMDDYFLRYSKNGGSFLQLPTSDTGDGIQAATAGLTDDADTTNRATNGISDPGAGSFVAGEQCTDGQVVDRQLTASNFTEHVWGVELIAANVTGGDTFDFDVEISGIVMNVVPRVTVSEGAAPTEISADAIGAGIESVAITVRLTQAALAGGIPAQTYQVRTAHHGLAAAIPRTARGFFQIAAGLAGGIPAAVPLLNKTAAALAGGLVDLVKFPKLARNAVAGGVAARRLKVSKHLSDFCGGIVTAVEELVGGGVTLISAAATAAGLSTVARKANLFRDALGAGLIARRLKTNLFRSTLGGGLPARRLKVNLLRDAIDAGLTALARKVNLSRSVTASGLTARTLKVFKTVAALGAGLVDAVTSTAAVTLQSAAALAGTIASVTVTYLQHFPPFSGHGGFGIGPEGPRQWKSWKKTWRKKTGRR